MQKFVEKGYGEGLKLCLWKLKGDGDDGYGRVW